MFLGVSHSRPTQGAPVLPNLGDVDRCYLQLDLDLDHKMNMQ